MWIDSAFDGGNIAVISADDPCEIELEIEADRASEHRQWFYFRMLGAKGRACNFRIMNAGNAAYPEAWPDGSIVVSYDGQHWFRRKTHYDDGVLSFDLDCEADVAYLALSPPFSQSQHHKMIVDALTSDRCALHDVISTIENRHIEILRIGTPTAERKNVWIIARQHPGEPMAEWFMHGLLRRLLHSDDPQVTNLLENCCIYLVPNMNPDGSIAGNLRTNAAGVDLNRAWMNPDPSTSPEVFHVKAQMERSGVDLFLDIHGDEEFRFVFAAGCEGNPSFTPKLAAQDARFRTAFNLANPDFSTQPGYPVDAQGTANLAIACNHIGEAFGCLALTIEMPFKDNAQRLDPIFGWGIGHSQALGASIVDPISAHFSDTPSNPLRDHT